MTIEWWHWLLLGLILVAAELEHRSWDLETGHGLVAAGEGGG